MNSGPIFSERHGLSAETPSTLAREHAPEQLRLAVIHFAADAGYPAEHIRERLLDLLCVPPEPELWVSEDNIFKETQRHLAKAEWFEVYDFIESLHRSLLKMGRLENAGLFERKINRFFEKAGIG